VALVGVALLAVGGCRSDPSSPRGVAERFLDAYYVQIDLAASSELAVGVAQSKIVRELELTRGVRIDADTRKPSIHYRLEDERGGEDAVRFVYRLTIVPEDAERFHRLVLLTLRDGGSGWQVSNFEELAE